MKDNLSHFIGKLCPYSIAIIMIIDFQFFGFNMLLGLSIDAGFFEYLTMTSISLFFGCLVKMKMAFMAMKMQNGNNPNLNQRNCSNPIMSFAIKVLISMSVF